MKLPRLNLPLSRLFTWAVALGLGLSFWVSKRTVEGRLESYSRPNPIVSLEAAQFYSRSAHKFSLGFDNLIADLTWVTLLQKASHEALTHPGVSWEYAKVRSIITLDPKFKRAYWFGSAFVSVFRRDKQGAKDILQQWTVRQPLTWQSHYMLGFHLFHEMGDYESAAGPMIRAASLPNAPSWLASLGVRLLSEAGGLFSSLRTAIELYDSVQDTEGRYRLRLRIRSLNYALQKARLKEAVETFTAAHARRPASFEELKQEARQPATQMPQLQIEHTPEELQTVLAERFEFGYDPSSGEISGLLAESDLALEHTGIHGKQK